MLKVSMISGHQMYTHIGAHLCCHVNARQGRQPLFRAAGWPGNETKAVVINEVRGVNRATSSLSSRPQDTIEGCDSALFWY
ncbi:MAG: hypothetical protein Q4D19_13245 [Lautropia sp.]|nr:hypothetical protein [Lautropia sp.]